MADVVEVTFKFPADAWPGIREALTRHSYQAYVPNPEFTPQNQTVPPSIANPVSKDEAAVAEVQRIVAERWKQDALQLAQQQMYQTVQAQVDARAAQVAAATTTTITGM